MNSLPIISVASPPPVPSLAAVNSYLASTMDQWTQFVTTVQQDFLAAWKALGQGIAHEMSSVQQQWDHLLGITTNPQSQSLGTPVPQPGSDSGTGRGNSSGSGSGKGAMSTANNAPNQPSNNSTPRTGSGSGSGSSSTTNHPIASGQGGTVHPMTSGTGSGSGSGSATVNGQVWLDNNGDGSLNNGEMGYYGVVVSLYSVADPNGDDPTLLATTTTTNAPTGNNYQIVVPASDLPGPGPDYFEILVGIPQYFYATYPSPASEINNAGFSPVFALAPGGVKNLPGGLRSAVVNTTDDDPNGPIKQNTVTLRDAIQTVINGLNQPVTFIVSGTIGLQKALPTLSTNMKIDGTNQTVTVQGNGNANNPYSIFTVSATVEIDKLTIKGGYANPASGGGGILSQGNLTLKSDVITGNSAPGFGGGMYVNGGTASMSGGSITNNTAIGQNGGGIYVNLGSLKLTHGVVISENNAMAANGSGGGMYINSGKVTISGGTIKTNTAGANGGSGGGIYNFQGALTLNANVQLPVDIIHNVAPNQGGGLYLGKASTTTFNACNVGGLFGNNNAGTPPNANAGKGVYWQNFATVINLPGLNDGDDPFGAPVRGN